MPGKDTSSLINELVPPYSVEAEKAVLGSMLIEKEAIETVINTLKEEDFHEQAHKIIFREIVNAYDRNRGDVDILIISDAVKWSPPSMLAAAAPTLRNS